MVPTDPTSPLRRPKQLGMKKRILYILLPLILINVGIIGTLAHRMMASANGSEVKDDTVSIPAEGDVADDGTSEEEISTLAQTPIVTVYTVKPGDTLSGIADTFNITMNTIRWANDLTSKSLIKPGDELTILPVSGVVYTVKKGDTLSGIAVKFDAKQEDILAYNDVEPSKIAPGMKLVIPEGEPLQAPAPKPVAKKPISTVTVKTVAKTSTPAVTSKTTVKEIDEDKDEESTPTSTGHTVPIHGILTQKIHDANAVDFGASTGTPVAAYKSGTVIVAKSTGYNGGYGIYIVVDHGGSCQTQYSHLSKVQVSVGDKVSEGEVIGKSGNTGHSTGPHLHFNVRNCGGNPYGKFKVGTQF